MIRNFAFLAELIPNRQGSTFGFLVSYVTEYHDSMMLILILPMSFFLIPTKKMG